MNRFGGRRPRWRLLMALLAVVALVAAACGDDDNGDNGDTASSATTAPNGDDTTTTSEPDASDEPEPGEPQAGGSAEVLLFSEIGTLDPLRITGSGGSDGQRAFALYGGLVVFTPETGEAEPLQAESFEPDGDDFTTWLLTLKPDMVFSDGTPFDAEAVKVNWERHQDPEARSPSFTTLMIVSEMEVVDDQTLRINLSTPHAHFDKTIARVGANYIASAQALRDEADMTSEAYGAGPFLLREWIRDDRMIMDANPDWNASPGPYLDELTFRVVGDEEQRIDTFITGDADSFYTSQPGSVSRATDAVDDAYYAAVQVNTGQAYVLNNRAAPFDDLRMRQIFAMGVDWEAMAETVFGAEAIVPATFGPPDGPWAAPDSELPGYDPEATQALIDEIVAETGEDIEFDMLAFQQTLDQQRGRFIQTALNQYDGLSVNVEVNDSPTNIGLVLAGDYTSSSWGFPHIDPEPGLWTALHSTSFTNYSGFANEEVDQLLDEARVLTDVEERAERYRRVYEIAAEELPFFPYHLVSNGFVTSPDLQGAEVYEDGILRVDLLWRAG